MNLNRHDCTILDVTSLKVLGEDEGEVSLLLQHGRSVDLRLSMRTLPRVIIAMFLLASRMEDRAHALRGERRVFALPIKDVGVNVIGTEEGRQAVVSIEFSEGAVFRFVLNRTLYRKLSGALDKEFGQSVH